MSVRGIDLSTDFIMSLHKELLVVFSEHYAIEIKTLTVFQLYGFGNYDDKLPNLKNFIIDRTGKWINGKYLYNKIKDIDKGNSKHIKVRREYLSLLITVAGYVNYEDYLKNSPHISSEIRILEETNVSSFDVSDETLYYVGYYVEDRQYYIKSKFTIYKMKTALWEILYWEKEFEPSYYTYFGKCVSTGESALSFYFNKENSSLNKECFINLFYGNNMKIKPVLLGAYCGFSRNNNPVIGKLVFEQVETLELQNEKAMNKEINPNFHYYLHSQRMEVEGVLPQKVSDLSNSLSRLKIVKFLIGDYVGFYLDDNNYLIPVSFQVLNKLGELKLKINNNNFKGIGRINNTENHLISEFTEKNISFSQFSIQIKPLERDLFLANMLVYVGADVLNGKVLLWKGNELLKNFMSSNKEFYLSINDLEHTIIEKIEKYLIGSK